MALSASDQASVEPTNRRSAVGYGGMALSYAGRPSEDVAIRVIHAALDAGITLIDTADVYCLGDHELGHNERLIAKALKQWTGPRDTIIVATKGGLTRPGGGWGKDGRPEYLRQACERSLRALDVECIDLYQFHERDGRVPLTDSVGALKRLQEAGKVRRIGLSNVSVQEIREASSVAAVTTVQNRLNPFRREALESGVLRHCQEHGIGFLAYSPVGGRQQGALVDHPVLRPIAQRHGVSPHAVVLAWLLAQGTNVIPIPSARSVEHVRDSARAAALRLSPEEIAAIDRGKFRAASAWRLALQRGVELVRRMTDRRIDGSTDRRISQ